MRSTYFRRIKGGKIVARDKFVTAIQDAIVNLETKNVRLTPGSIIDELKKSNSTFPSLVREGAFFQRDGNEYSAVVLGSFIARLIRKHRPNCRVVFELAELTWTTANGVNVCVPIMVNARDFMPPLGAESQSIHAVAL